jgi:hypothetical protein
MNKLPYEAPKLSTWGSITDLTQGTGMTYQTDDFETCLPDMTFIGSNDNEQNRCPE